MQILYVASECAPFIKTGGLADVVGAVPKSLRELGLDVRIALPAYPALKELLQIGQVVNEYEELFGGPARVVAVQAEQLDLLLLDAPHLFDRPGNIYLNDSSKDWDDNHMRFGALCMAATDIALGALPDWRPDIVHAHDWQAGLVPLLLKMADRSDAPPSVLTIHNIAFQGLFDWTCKDLFGVPDEYFTSEGAEYYGHFGFLKAGLAFCDKITTVSPTYARELLTAEFGMGLDGLLQARSHKLTGILNGIDLEVWNPKTDQALAAPYSVHNRTGKAINRTAVEERFGLQPDPTSPLFCVISRLTEQKGLDLLLEAVPHLIAQGGRLALLGSGHDHLEEGFAKAQRDHPGKVGAIIGYDEPLSHLMQGGSDAILIPSRFEPCGLTQLYGLRYGTLPVVARTGGLADTVVDANTANLKSKTATGFLMEPGSLDDLRHAITRACELHARPKTWRTIMGAAMRYPVGWDQSAPGYLKLYRDMLPHKDGNRGE